MNDLKEEEINRSIDTYSAEQTRLFKAMKDAKHVSDEKPIKLQLACISTIITQLLRLRTLRRIEQEKVC
jgi:hypothetical protein